MKMGKIGCFGGVVCVNSAEYHRISYSFFIYLSREALIWDIISSRYSNGSNTSTFGPIASIFDFNSGVRQTL